MQLNNMENHTPFIALEAILLTIIYKRQTAVCLKRRYSVFSAGFARFSGIGLERIFESDFTGLLIEFKKQFQLLHQIIVSLFAGLRQTVG